MPEDPIEELAKTINLEELFSTLTPQQVEILTLRYGLKGGKGMGRKELSQKFRLSPERLRQIEQQALTSLRKLVKLEYWE